MHQSLLCFSAWSPLVPVPLFLFVLGGSLPFMEEAFLECLAPESQLCGWGFTEHPPWVMSQFPQFSRQVSTSFPPVSRVSSVLGFPGH